MTGKQPPQAEEYLRMLMSRYTGATPEALMAVLCPLLIPIDTLDKTAKKLSGEAHYRASFTVKITAENASVLRRGRTGKFVPASYAAGTGPWLEIAKGRIIDVDSGSGIASGEVHVSGGRGDLIVALANLDGKCLLEIDQYGASAKVLSALTEHFLCLLAQQNGYEVSRLPEDMAKHLGSYANYDFEFKKSGVVKRVEAKSLWGTDTSYARLIHSTTTKPPGDPNKWKPEARRNYYPTSSCKFDTQDIFAVNLFLRTGDIRDFAFARSVPKDKLPHGLPRCDGFPEHVNQNPLCRIGDGTWFATIDEVWSLP